MDVYQSLTDFVQRFVAETAPETRKIDYDNQWPSPCIEAKDPVDGEIVTWSPTKQDPAQSFDDMENALEMALHPDVKAFYSYYWSDNLPAKAAQGECELLQPWNPDDFARLQENLIGHVLMKKRLNQAITLFIGVTDEDDFILCVENDSGRVVLEQVGREPQTVLASSLSEFIQSLVVR